MLNERLGLWIKVSFEKLISDRTPISGSSFTELIVGLPDETRESHIYANRKLIDLGFEVWNYFLHLLPGTEMDEAEYRKKFFKQTGFRLHDNSYGIYKGKKIFEAQETILKTNNLITHHPGY